MEALIVFPNQLFITPTATQTLIYIEDEHFFARGTIQFHKHKLILHRASMQHHYQLYQAQAQYFSYPLDTNALAETLKGFDRILAYDPVDHSLRKKFSAYPIKWMDTPNFINSVDDIHAYFKDKKSFFMHYFYIHQRKTTHILMDDEGNPLGGQFSFDQDNRKKLPKDIDIPKGLTFKNAYIDEATAWVEDHFPNNPGMSDTFNYPVHRQDALKQLRYFLDYKFEWFGPYQDAFSEADAYLFHSNLSSSLNTGLLSPKEIVSEALKKGVSIQSKEGFIRQIIGWREFMRAVYMLKGNMLKTQNELNHHNRVSDAWFKGTTQIPIVDQTIQKLNRYAYSHHIERLMVLGNIMMLSNIHPEDVYSYFMTMHIDAYDWVMTPNIYGMSQFAAGPLMTTKPYFSGANYLKKMGVKNGPWSETWDALFYMFLSDHKSLIQRNPRLKLLINNLNKKDEATLKHYQTLKATFLKNVTQ